MKITQVTTQVYRIPPKVAWEDATNKVNVLEFVIVTLFTDKGMCGTGISYSVDIGGTSIQALIDDYLSDLVIGMDPLCYEEIWGKLQRQSRRLGLGVNAMAIAAIDIAVWDLMGKYYGQPIYRLLGGARRQIPAYVSEINLSAGDTLQDLQDRVQAYVRKGYRAVKIKIGKEDIEEDVERIRKVQELLGPGGRVFVDLNQKWSSAEAIAKAARLDAFDLGWIEEPLLFHDIQGHRRLKNSVRTPIALGESLHSRHQFLEFLKADAVDIVQADVAFVGGITEWHRIAQLANVYGKAVAPHYLMELSLQLLCGVPNGLMLEDVVGGSFTELGLLKHPITVEQGVGIPNSLPGHGIIFDEAALSPYRVKRTV